MQQAYLTLDYELFFGPRSGSVEQCLIEPTEAVAALVEKYAGRLVLFVDVGFIVALHRELKKYPRLNQSLHRIHTQLENLVARGHDVQLHIHPHWQDSHFDGEQWCVNTFRYRLHDYSKTEVHEIVRDYKQCLTEIAGDSVFAYRAGGWCIQPFDHIKESLKKEQIWLDSTVYHNGLSEDSQRGFDFRNAPHKSSWWRFEDDPLQEQEDGYFVELPISAQTASPVLFWKMAIMQKLLKKLLKPYGDGKAMQADGAYYFNRLRKSSVSVLSIDGIKADFTLKIIQSGHYKGEIINIMGHPKSLSRYSLAKFEELLQWSNTSLRFTGFQDLLYLRIPDHITANP